MIEIVTRNGQGVSLTLGALEKEAFLHLFSTVELVEAIHKRGINNEIPTSRVPEGPYVMDPITEDLVSSATLRNGLIVLAEDFYHSGKRTDLARDYWCRITELQHRGDLISFIGVYADGSKHTRTYNKSYNWFMKKI